MGQHKHRKNREIKNWQPPPDLFAPCDSGEFKFCFSLMNAAGSGQMVVERPKPMMIEGLGEVSLGNTPMNRGLLAISKHLREFYPEGSRPYMAISNRVVDFGTFVMKCVRNKDARIEKYVKLDPHNEEALEIADALIEAAAIAKIDKDGFDGDSLFAIAGDLAAKGVESFAAPA